MTCPGCSNPTGGLVVAGCRQCQLREIASGPEFFASQQARVLTPAYMARLQSLGTVEAVHIEVKAIAEQLKGQK